ncbi:MAG: DUF4118 domain-containing protein [Spirochaetia bacterium]|nr:DUF4118 domain-containing protein [Spirochaetia bacterium]
MIEAAETTIVPNRRAERRPFWDAQRWFDGAGASGWPGYTAAVLMVGVVTLLNVIVQPYIGANAVLLVYLLAILLASMILQRGPVLFGAGLCALAWNFVFLQPFYTLHIREFDDAVMFMMFFAVALIAGSVTGQLRQQALETRKREEQLAFLNATASRMNMVLGLEEVVAAAEERFWERFSGEAVIFLLDEKEDPHRAPCHSGRFLTGRALDQARSALAGGPTAAVLEGTGTFFLPLWGRQGKPVGVVQLSIAPNHPLTNNDGTLLSAFVDQLGILLDRELLVQLSQKIRTNEEIDKLYTTLLNLITHELRTPMSIIKGAITVMREGAFANRPQDTAGLASEALDSLARLDRLVENLLDMSRIESGKLKLNLDWCDLADIAGSAVRHVLHDFPEGRVKLLHDHSHLIRLDFNLMEKVFYGLLRNALIHNQAMRETGDLELTLASRFTPAQLQITIRDNGKGLPSPLAAHPFAKFSRGNDSVEGLGMGLSIVKGIVEAHGGAVRYEFDEGAKFILEFPVTSENTRPFRIAK